eukprot:scaffold6784_cov108-Cylindrotheca_fusiformis.AAC.15
MSQLRSNQWSMKSLPQIPQRDLRRTGLRSIRAAVPLEVQFHAGTDSDAPRIPGGICSRDAYLRNPQSCDRFQNLCKRRIH